MVEILVELLLVCTCCDVFSSALGRPEAGSPRMWVTRGTVLPYRVIDLGWSICFSSWILEVSMQSETRPKVSSPIRIGWLTSRRSSCPMA
jgi:hypothetical protein